MPRGVLHVSRRARPEVGRRGIRQPIGSDPLNDLFALFPELPPVRHPPVAGQLRRRRENIEPVQEQTRAGTARHRAVAAHIKPSWPATRRR